MEYFSTSMWYMPLKKLLIDLLFGIRFSNLVGWGGKLKISLCDIKVVELSI